MRPYVTIKTNEIIISTNILYKDHKQKPSYFIDQFAIVTKMLHCHKIAICQFYKIATLKAIIENTTQKVCPIIQLLPYNLTVQILCGG